MEKLYFFGIAEKGRQIQLTNKIGDAQMFLKKGTADLLCETINKAQKDITLKVRRDHTFTAWVLIAA